MLIKANLPGMTDSGSTRRSDLSQPRTIWILALSDRIVWPRIGGASHLTDRSQSSCGNLRSHAFPVPEECFTVNCDFGTTTAQSAATPICSGARSRGRGRFLCGKLRPFTSLGARNERLPWPQRALTPTPALAVYAGKTSLDFAAAPSSDHARDVWLLRKQPDFGRSLVSAY